MRFHVVLVFISLAFLTGPTAARQGGKGGDDSVREACREEARQAIQKSRTSRLDQEQLKEMRREYARKCRQKAR